MNIVLHITSTGEVHEWPWLDEPELCDACGLPPRGNYETALDVALELVRPLADAIDLAHMRRNRVEIWLYERPEAGS